MPTVASVAFATLRISIPCEKNPARMGWIFGRGWRFGRKVRVELRKAATGGFLRDLIKLPVHTVASVAYCNSSNPTSPAKKRHADWRAFLSMGYEKDGFAFLIDGFELSKPFLSR